MTVEASLLLPFSIFFLLNLGSVIELIRLHNNLQFSLWNTGRELAIYGYERDSNLFTSMLSGWYIKNRVTEELGEDYLNQSMIQNGIAGLSLWDSEMYTGHDTLDLTLSYSIEPLFPLVGFRSFRMANRVYTHLWNGYEIPENAENHVMVYVTENGEVWHTERECTHIRLSIRQVEASFLSGIRNRWGNRYVACDKCVRDGMPGYLFITDEGNCYHARQNCSGLKRTVSAITLEQAQTSGYRPCSRCAE